MVDTSADASGFNFSHTYNANAISCATALAVLDEYERLDLIRQAEQMGSYLGRELEALKERVSIIGDVRGIGMLRSVELVADRRTKKLFPDPARPTEDVRIHGLRNGLMIYSRRTADGRNGDWFMVSPPLTITLRECDELIRRLERTLTDLTAAYAAAGIL